MKKTDKSSVFTDKHLKNADIMNHFNFIQQKSPTSISGEINVKLLSVQWGFKPRLNEVKASGGDIRF